MTFSVYQHWDRLQNIAVGSSYPPQLYDYISNKRVRNVFYRIAEETEEDYLKLIALLETFGVDIVRTDVSPLLDIAKWSIIKGERIPSPGTMQPRDVTLMLGNTYYYTQQAGYADIVKTCKDNGCLIEDILPYDTGFKSPKNHTLYMTGAITTRVGKDLYIGSFSDYSDNDIASMSTQRMILKDMLPDYRLTFVDTKGHTDGCFCPVVPGLILSIEADEYEFEKTFPGWEVVYLPNESWSKMKPFLEVKHKNKGKWWVPGEELNQDFTDYVESWMSHWVGYAEESVFDVNLIVVDQKNVIVNGYNKKAFDAFDRYGITPHICNFRHRYFWDGGLHCITSDLNREGMKQDYFPERKQESRHSSMDRIGSS